MTRFLRYLRVWLPCFTLLFIFIPTFAQSSTATLSGTVEDQNGAPIPTVSVTVENVGTRIKREVTTNENGYFTMPLLQPGEYTLLVRRDGFASVQIPTVILNVGDQKSLQIAMKVGDVNAAVEVRSDASTVRTDGSVGTVIDRQFVENIPLNGRSFQSLLELTPGVVLAPAGSATQTGGQFSVNGQRTNSNYFTVDGVSANAGVSSDNSGFVGLAGSGQLPALTTVGTTSSLVSVDALQEFRIQTSTYAPEFGRTPGGQISLVTRSGENKFHGTLFEYIRNDVLDANDWFANANSLERAPLRQNQFGGTFSGPVFLPRFGEGGSSWYNGKNRTFFFFSYEGLRLIQPRTALFDVPNLCVRGRRPVSECSGLNQGAAATVWRPYLDTIPLPNREDILDASGNPTGFAKFAASYSNESRFDTTAIRFDQQIGSLNFFGRYSRTPSFSKTRVGVLSSIESKSQINDTLTVGSTWLITNQIVNDLRINYTRNAAPYSLDAVEFGGGIIPPIASIFPSGRTPENSRVTFVVSGGGNLQWGANNVNSVQRQFNLVEGLTATVGNHQMKFGADFRRIFPSFADGSSDFVQQTIVVTLANLRAGTFTSYQLLRTDDKAHEAVFDNLSLYTQDTWQINPRFTLTYGVRWEFVPPPRSGPTSALTFENMDTLSGSSPQARFAPPGTPFWNTRYNNFAPRIGVSYQVVNKASRELVLRGGTGIFYDLGYGGIANSLTGLTYPFFAQITYSNLPFPLTPVQSVLPIPGSSNVGQIFLDDIKLVLPRVYQWNVSAEQSLGTRQVLSVSFIGSEGRKLLKREQYNQVNILNTPPPVSTVFVTRNLGYANYRALQIQFQRRLTNGIQGLVSYTLGRSRDTASGDVETTVPQERASQDLTYGYSDFDVRHNLTAAISYRVPKINTVPWLQWVLRDWGVDSMFRFRTAFPIAITSSVPFPPGNLTVRSNLIPDVPIWINDPAAPGGRRINTAPPTDAQVTAAGCTARTATNAKGAFCTPLPGTQGNSRGLIRGFNARQIDLAFRREFPLFERSKLQLSWEIFNITNTPNFGAIQGNLTSSIFGTTTNMLGQQLGGLSATYQIGGSRSMQAGIKFIF